MPRTFLTPLAALALCVGLAACSATQRQGSVLARSGQYAEATQVYVDALRANPGHGWARSGMRRYGELAYLQTLDLAREREAEGDYEVSLVAYDEVIGLLSALKTYDALTFTPDTHLRAERDGVRRKLLETRYREGVANASLGRWDTALARFESASEIDPGYLDLPAQIERSHRALAEQALEQRRYADAVRAFQAAHALSGDTEHLAWAAAILAATGRYYLRQGACRQAVDALEGALPHAINDATLEATLDAALECARVELVVEPFEVAFGLAVPENLDLGAMVADKLSEQLVAQGSRHVRLIDPALGRAAREPSATSHRFAVRGRISRLEVQRLTLEPITEQTQGTLRDLCPGHSGYYTSTDALCDEEVAVAYRRDEQTVEMKLSAALKVLDPVNGEQKLTRTHDASAFQSAVQLSEFKRVFRGEWTPTAISASPMKDTVMLPEAIVALQSRPAPLPTDADMVSAAAENLAVQVAAVILTSVDVEVEAAAPKALANIRRPLTDPNQIELQSGEVTSQPVPGREPPPEPEQEAEGAQESEAEQEAEGAPAPPEAP